MLGDFGSYWDVDLTPLLTFLGEGSNSKPGKALEVQAHFYLIFILSLTSAFNVLLCVYFKKKGVSSIFKFVTDSRLLECKCNFI